MMRIIILLASFVLAKNVMCDGEVPDQIDWREKGAVTKVKDEGSCDGDFYFAALGTIESYYYLSTGEIIDLSEQSAVDCSLGFNNGCNGGGLLNTLEFVRNKGIALEESYPYVGTQGDCQMNESTSLLKTMGYKMVPKDEEEVKNTVGTVGPVAVTFTGNITSYTEGIYSDLNCSSSSESHSGIIVGYGTSDDAKDYWIVKMSYGTKWGEDGYMRIGRNGDNQCGIIDSALYPVL